MWQRLRRVWKLRRGLLSAESENLPLLQTLCTALLCSQTV
jgi:hypothetical protein